MDFIKSVPWGQLSTGAIAIIVISFVIGFVIIKLFQIKNEFQIGTLFKGFIDAIQGNFTALLNKIVNVVVAMDAKLDLGNKIHQTTHLKIDDIIKKCESGMLRIHERLDGMTEKINTIKPASAIDKEYIEQVIEMYKNKPSR